MQGQENVTLEWHTGVKLPLEYLSCHFCTELFKIEDLEWANFEHLLINVCYGCAKKKLDENNSSFQRNSLKPVRPNK